MVRARSLRLQGSTARDVAITPRHRSFSLRPTRNVETGHFSTFRMESIPLVDKNRDRTRHQHRDGSRRLSTPRFPRRARLL